MSKAKRVYTDGLNGRDIERIKKALRQVWSWSYPRRLVVARSTSKTTGFAKCEKCLKRCAKIYVDHIEPVGTFDKEYMARLFVPSSKLQGLCGPCHKAKTKSDLVAIKDKMDFY